MSVRPALRRPLAALAVAAVGLVPLVSVPPAQAATDASKVVISEVYGGGASGGATYERDFVELYNPTSQAVVLDGTSVQYRSSGGTGNPTGVTVLTGTIPARSTFLVGEGGTTTGATPLPTPDVSGSIGLKATDGTIFLAAQTTPLTAPSTGSVTASPTVLDVVGYGSTNTFEKAPAAAGSTTTSLARTATGVDTDDNSADLTVGAPTPTPVGEVTAPPDPTITDLTIEEIQGTGPASTHQGEVARTTGVVTAAYPTGGFRGFYLQAEGTGGDVDPASHTASDAVFVFGSSAVAAVATGDHVQVTGTISEYVGTTELTPSAASDVVVLDDSATVRPSRIALPRTEAVRESFEGMLLAPQGDYTVTDSYDLNKYGELGLASGTTALPTPTDVADPNDPAAIRAVEDENAARAIKLDDGASTVFTASANAVTDQPLPYLSQEREIRVGAPVTFDQPVVLEWRNSAWKLQPTAQVTGTDPLPVTFGHTRTAAPAATGGNLHVASFNVLNYFPTTGQEFVEAGGKCTFYDDREGNHNTDNRCTTADGGDGPRGAAEDDDLARQQAKIVAAINTLGADVVSLEEIENSARFGQDRDAAVGTLVEALNAKAGAGTWAFVPTPASAGDQSDEDVIRTAFIYRTATAEPVGESAIDDVDVFVKARDPLAQAFEPVGGDTGSRVVVIVNHFKSKSPGPGSTDTGQGAFNELRVAQAHELVDFADRMKQQLGSDQVLLSGDFNAYTEEDPMRVLAAAGYTDLGRALAPDEHTYQFGGTVGSLDHVLANAPALKRVTGAHVWNINSVEPIALEYSRFNYNLTDFYTEKPYRASDHDPLVVGLDLPLAPVGPVATTIRAGVTPHRVEFKRDHPVVRVRVRSSAGPVDGGLVEVRERRHLVRRATVSDGIARITLPAYNTLGWHVLEVRYLGTDGFEPSATIAVFTVEKSKKNKKH